MTTFAGMKKMDRDKRTLDLMIGLYCRHKHRSKSMCCECEELLRYAVSRLTHCKFGEEKPACKRCPIHCYRPEMRERMREVMRYAGPRMLFYSPWAAIRHLLGK